jgi:ATP-dependent protease Clp ATPase subunit
MSTRMVKEIFCDFCKKAKPSVGRIVALENGDVHICDCCVGLCVEILAEDDARELQTATPAKASVNGLPSSE